MGPLPPTIIQIMSSFAPLFSARVWPHAQVLLTGAILAPGKRTVRALLRVMGLDHRSDFQTYHRVLNRCVWSPLEGSQRLLQVLLATFAPPPAAGWFLAWTIRLSVVEGTTLQPRVSIAIRCALVRGALSKPVGYAGCR